MKKPLFTLIIFLYFTYFLNGQSFIPLELSGYNADVIVDQGEDISQSGCIDDLGWAYYSTARKQEGGLETNFNSRSKIPYRLNSFKENNALHFRQNGAKSGTLTLKNPIHTSELWLLGTAGNGPVEIRINYSDGTKSTFQTEFSDWFQENADRTAIYGLGRILTRGNDAGRYEEHYRFSLFERVIRADPDKTINSLEIKTINNTSFTTIFAATALDVNSPREGNKSLYFISNSHLDTQWNWTVKTVIEEYLPKTMRQNFALFDAYPNFHFNFEGAIKYMWMKEYYPEEYEKLKKYIEEGRWNISGGSIDANDVMVPSSESMLRNFLYGQKYYEKEFGRKGGMDIMLPDCFGFPYSLPTVAKHAGVTGFHTAKLKWGSAAEYDDLPSVARWRGVDGSEIYAVLKPDAYDNEGIYHKNMSYDGDIYSEIVINEINYNLPAAFKYIGNRGDIGGSVENITAEWLETSVTSSGPVTVKLASPDEAFAAFAEAHDNLPIWDDELAMRRHGVGCYTSQTILKYWNRKNELLADATEKTSVISDWLGTLKYQHDPITNSWIKVIWHQFHDDLPGTSIPEAYAYTYNDQVVAQLDLSKTLVNSVGAVTRNLNTSHVKGTPIVVYNPLSIERTDIAEASLVISTKPTTINVVDKDGNAVPAQITDYKDGEVKFIFLATVPSVGYTTYDVRLNEAPGFDATKAVTITNNTIENDQYKITIDQNGDIASILDKQQGNKELLLSPIRLAMIYNEAEVWPAWELRYQDLITAPREYVSENVKITIAEEGPLRAAFKVTRTAGESEFVQYIRLASYGQSERVDFVNEVNWQTRERVLKAVFPLTATNEKATYDMSIGAIVRGNSNKDSYEFAGHQWADLTDNEKSYGISILNDCKYGWDKPDNNTLRLSLIQTPQALHTYHHHGHQDLGLNKFTYSFYRHLGDWNESTQWEASKLNQPLMAFEVPKREGSLGDEFGFVNINNDKVAVKALKKAETSDEIIIRVYELTGNDQNDVEISFAADIATAKEVNGLEEEVGTASYSGNKLNFAIGRFAPKTFAVKLAAPKSVLELPSTETVTLPYNADVMSYDGNMKDGEFGSTGYAYPAELIEDELIADGISFTMGNRADGAMNAVVCQGQEITLPKMDGAKKLYLLAASQSYGGSVADFKVDGQTTSMAIEYFADNVGEWDTYYGNRNYKPENPALVLTHRHDVKEGKNVAYHFLYLFKYAISVSEGATKLTLPVNTDIILFAATLSDNENDDVVPLFRTPDLPVFEDIEAEEYLTTCNSLLIPSKISASGYTNNNEAPAKAADNSSFTKWCDNSSSNKWLEYDFGKEVEICRWHVIHAGRESGGMITADFKLLYYNEKGEWVSADIVTGNTENKTHRTISTIRTTKVRLAVDKGEQNGTIARIFGFYLYGDASPVGIENEVIEENMVYNYPNPFKDHTTIICETSVVSDLVLNIYDIAGKVVDTIVYPINLGGKQELLWYNKGLSEGIYFYNITSKESNKVIQIGKGKMMIK